VSPLTIKELEEKGCKVIDATCPDVKRVQENAKQLAEQGYRVIIIGKADHPEVVGIKAHADIVSNGNTIVISSPNEIINHKDEIVRAGKIGIVVQTTQTSENFKKILSELTDYSKELKVHNTICAATFKRQQEAQALAKEVKLMVVVGSRSSANTTHLAEILSKITNTIHIETYKELDQHKDILEKSEKIGITAGASTPDYVINDVLMKIGDYISE